MKVWGITLQVNVLVARLSWTVSHHVMALSDNNWVAQFTLKPSGMLIWIMVFSTFIIHLPAISASCSLIYDSQPISLTLLTSHTSSTTLPMVVPVIEAASGICVVRVVCVAELAMPFITTLTICTRSLATYCRGTLVGIVDSCASDLSCCSTATRGTSFVWLGLRPSSAITAPPCKVLGGITEAWDVVSFKGSSSCQP